MEVKVATKVKNRNFIIYVIFPLNGDCWLRPVLWEYSEYLKHYIFIFCEKERDRE